MIVDTLKGLYYLSLAKYFHPEHHALAWKELPTIKRKLAQAQEDIKTD